jgi:hypothetical protein
MYIKNITSIENLGILYHADIPRPERKLTLLYDPPPFYSKKKDDIVVLATSSFGARHWTLPCFEV